MNILKIKITDQDGAHNSSSNNFDLMPSDLNAQFKFYPITIPLSEFRGKRVFSKYAAETIGGDADAHWIGFSYPRLVVVDNE